MGRAMSPVPAVPVTDLDDPRIADYRDVSDAVLLERRGLFVAEGRLVVRRLLDGGRYTVRSLLVTPAALAGLDKGDSDTGDGSFVREGYSTEAPVPFFVVSFDLMRRLTGFNFHRGCLALAERPAPVAPAEVLGSLAGDAVVVALEEITNADNVGGVFRNAAAFGAGAVLLSPGCCDPLYRKAIRTSMATALRVPFARVEPWPAGLAALRTAGFSIVALTPAVAAQDLVDFARDPSRPRRVALVVGTEGAGLSAAAETLADARVRIPMAPGVDSLNLATATGIALYNLSIADGRWPIED